MSYYAHTKKNKSKDEWQLLKNHLNQVAELSCEFASKFGSPLSGYVTGLVHDLGKYADELQEMFDNDEFGEDHSTAGAREIARLYPNGMGQLLSYVPAGHHSGLPDGDGTGKNNLDYRINKKEINDYFNYLNEFNILTSFRLESELKRPLSRDDKTIGFSLAFYIRMLFSAVVDADSLDTEGFYNKNKSLIRKNTPTMNEIYEKFNIKVEKLRKNSLVSTSKVDKIRTFVLEECIKKSTLPPGFLSLNVPTGGAKTYSSFALAVNHAIKYNKSRIIYVVPYTSITEQNAESFREVLGDGVILEHHSSFEYPDDVFDKWDSSKKQNYLASENWDMPVIVTTAVQFYESLFSNKRTKCRKLHNLANSVIILDEAQLTPIEYFKPCIWALAELVGNYGATVVFCTATQPNFQKFLPPSMKVTEIIPDPIALHNDLKRVKANYVGKLMDKQVAILMNSHKQSLCIVNTRKHAYKLYKELCAYGKEGVFHLSNRMCSKHRSSTISKIKKRLKDGLSCKVVSTQLIEAGVNIDFPIVFRSIAGIDSIIQAAGRANREGNISEGDIVIFEPEKHGMPTLGRFRECADITLSILKEGLDPLSLAAVNRYFAKLYKYEEQNLDIKGILDLTKNSADKLNFPFKEINDRFSLIESVTIPIFVPYDNEAKKIIQKLKTAISLEKPVYEIVRQLQSYTVQIYNHEFTELKRTGNIGIVGDECYWVLENESLYDKLLGLVELESVESPLNKVLIL